MKNIIDFYKKYPQVKAIAIGGSSSAKTSDEISDIDVYVFTTSEIPILERENFVKDISTKYEVGGEYFGSGDEYLFDSLNVQFDVMFWDVSWFENVVENIWNKHYPSNGYSTAFLYTLDVCEIIYDSGNWLKDLKNKIKTEYPENLQKNIIRRNMMLLKDKPFASYFEQIEKAIKRNDIVSVNHRISAFLASYFDIIFAINKLLHPGEKRIIKYALENCKILPKDFELNIDTLLKQSNNETLYILDSMVTNLKSLI
jgi:hypothetical protein